MKNRILWSVASLAILLVSSSRMARAAHTVKYQCVVTKVGMDDRLFVDCGDESFVAYNGGTCNYLNPDGLKMVMSLATSALLSGKKVNVSYESASPCANAIYSIDVFAN